ncbi:ABC transporter ATP-binding protein [Paraliobacillus quinghaiensis]|uniref:ABC transporter ATP-binding protein n=1 Tax=Paraliobacillus quinghaiensis TaxID=470815 RepID=A0A917TU65_9BACI|nr:ABC transporter ATP-binding protein [Paraliobacillus quinghaiensis]GGM38154.1 ABC transporter ATP-binding protein [Paraliobacillus quinghaiensis]
MGLTVQKINKTYRSGETTFHALKDVTLEMETGEIAVILGPSGSGKSTLLNAIGGIDQVDNGDISVEGWNVASLSDKESVNYRREMIGFVFQMNNLIPNLTVYENIEVAANISTSPLKINDVIDDVGLSGMGDCFPRELSGGQQQRVSIARAIVRKPKLLLCDEPTGSLDSVTSKDILSLLKKMNSNYNITTLIITHNEAISQMADRIIQLKDGMIDTVTLNENIYPPERIEW